MSVPEHFNGYPGVTHGGIVAALLDETAGRSILMDGGFDDLMVTAKLEVAYRRPTPTGVPLQVVGRLTRRSGARAEAAGGAAPAGRDGDGPGDRAAGETAGGDHRALGGRAEALAGGLVRPRARLRALCGGSPARGPFRRDDRCQWKAQ